MIIDEYLICANRFTNDLVCFPIREDGTLGDVLSRVEVPEAIALIV